MSLSVLFVSVLALLSLIYGLVLSGFLRGLVKLRRIASQTTGYLPSVSIIIPARNEARVLERTLKSLLHQNYKGWWEVVVVDDRSTDGTAAILQDFVQSSDRVRVLTVTVPYPVSPKKNALALGIRESRGEIIVTTDADCTYDRSWLSTMVSHMTEDTGVVAGLTVFDLPEAAVPAWQKIQWLDFFAQQLLAAGAAGAGVPSSCNGSNLAYRRSVYEQIAGFGSIATLVSGDDVLFAQRVSKLTSWKVVFATEPESIVRSLPVRTVRDVFSQRIRWASKGLAYRKSMSVFLFGMYAYYLLWVAAPLIMLAAPWCALPILGIAAWKAAWDYFTIRAGCRIFGERELLRYFLPFVALHTVLTPVFGVGGLLVPYRWKGNSYHTTTLPFGVKRGIVRMRRMVRSRNEAETVS
ncbi:MAG TPA: glycosyltransferase [bacterium]|jgi:cellulose synthase/poly-beta-1,6-N-acetylglucosamine synthase-like glycosyltransferase